MSYLIIDNRAQNIIYQKNDIQLVLTCIRCFYWISIFNYILLIIFKELANHVLTLRLERKSLNDKLVKKQQRYRWDITWITMLVAGSARAICESFRTLFQIRLIPLCSPCRSFSLLIWGVISNFKVLINIPPVLLHPYDYQ